MNSLWVGDKAQLKNMGELTDLIVTILEIDRSQYQYKVTLDSEYARPFWVGDHNLERVDIKKPGFCWHDNVEYVGLTDMFKYCKKCGKKEKEQ